MIDSKKNYRDSRQEFERHLNILKELNINLVQRTSRTSSSLDRARLAPNNRVDLNTIDSSVRATAMVSEYLKDFNRDEE